MNTATVAIDVMSGDNGAANLLLGTLLALRAEPALRVILTGHERIIRSTIETWPESVRLRVTVCATTEVIAMDDSPTQILRSKKNSSMRRAIEFVADGTLRAAVSAGNTGALMALSKIILKTLPGIDRPALSALLPTKQHGRPIRILDLGANVDCTPMQLYQFAIMGSILSQVEQGIAVPRVGLLNIGAELVKGNELIKQTAALLSSAKGICYHGYLEPDRIYDGSVDVLVCDGFTGNILLKGIEGTIDLVENLIKNEFKHDAWSKFVGLQARPIFRRLRRKVDPGQYNGANLVGLRGIVVKSHGGAKAEAFAQAIAVACLAARQDLVGQIAVQLSQIF